MACEGCLETFTAAPTDHSRAKHIDSQQPECCCESCQVSPHTLDPVSHTEELVRVVMDPDHIEQQGGQTRLKSSFFSDAASMGASCLRRGRATAAEYVRTIEMILEKRPLRPDGSPRKVYGVVVLSVSDIKRIVHSVDQKNENSPPTVIEYGAFGVYATGEEDRPNHADVMTASLSKIGTSKALRAGANLTKAAQAKFKTVAEFQSEVDLTKWA